MDILYGFGEEEIEVSRQGIWLVVSFLTIFLACFMLLAPIVPLGSANGDSLPPQQIIAMRCHGSLCPDIFLGRGFGSVSFALVGVGGYYYAFIDRPNTPNIYAFIW